MEKYKEIKKLAEGSFGIVIKAQNLSTSEIVAIKKMKQKYTSWDECINLRELKSLRKLVHVNIVKLKEVVRVNDELSFVFEYLDKNIFQLYDECKKSGTTLPEPVIRVIFYQIANALSYIHKHGFFHRDLKPENILITHSHVVKLIDFGLAREIRSRPPFTDYVSTRWYRAPEIILRSTNYNSPVDIFALGCIMAELYMMKPLFNGASELDQLNKLCSVLGTPNKNDWPEGYRLASLKGINFPAYPTIPLQQVLTNAPPEAVQLIAECLRWDSQKRPTAGKILQHPYFANVEAILPKELTTAPPEQQGQQQQQQSPLISKKDTSSTSANSGGGVQQQQQHPPNRRLMASREESAKIRENLYNGNYNGDNEDYYGGGSSSTQQQQKENAFGGYNNKQSQQQSQQQGGGGFSLNLDSLGPVSGNKNQNKPFVQSAIDLNSKQIKGTGLEMPDQPLPQQQQKKLSLLNNNNSSSSTQQQQQQQQPHQQLKSKNSFDVDQFYDFLTTTDPNQKKNNIINNNNAGTTENSNPISSHKQTPSYQERIKQRDTFNYNYDFNNSSNQPSGVSNYDYLSSLAKDRNTRATSLNTDMGLKGLGAGNNSNSYNSSNNTSNNNNPLIQRQHKNEYSYSMQGSQKTEAFGGFGGVGAIGEEPDSLGQYLPSNLQSNSSRMRGGGLTLDSGPRMGGVLQQQQQQKGAMGNIGGNINNNQQQFRNEFNNKSSFDIYNFGNVGGGGGGGIGAKNNNQSFSGSNSSMGLVMPTFGQKSQQQSQPYNSGLSLGGGNNNNNDLYNFNNVGLPPRKNML